MKKTLLAIALSSALVPLAPAVAAESDVELSANFGLVSDYRFRGVSQTDKEMAAQGGFDMAHKSGFYIGTWTSNVSDFANPNGNGLEIDGYLGYSTEVGGIGIDIGNLYYYYPANQGS
ncbi:MAG: TorF family putative porin, partial [Burkholderiaceae bacterium]